MSPFLHYSSAPLSSLSHRHCPSNFLLISLFIPLLLLIPLATTASVTGRTTSFSEYIQQNVFYHKDTCYKDSFVFLKENDVSAGQSAFTVFSTTKECSRRLREANLPRELPNCPPGLIDLSVQPLYVARSQMSYPYANLNISVTAHSSVKTIVFRLECLSTSDGSDVYCSDKHLYIDGVKEWPCRALDLSPLVRYPARLSYTCFRLTSHSIYAINATILPHGCRSVQIVTAPSFNHIYPEVLVDPMYEDDADNDPMWAPMISVDLTDPSGVWVRLGRARQAKCDVMMVNVYKLMANDSSQAVFVETLQVKCPDDGVKWVDLKAGSYLLTAYVPIRGCQFSCQSADRSCRQCLRTHLTVLIPESRASWTWLTLQTMRDHSTMIFVAAVVIILILAGILCTGIVYAVYKMRKESKRVREIRLTEYVKTMVVYADDVAEHTECVKLLVESLRRCATCEPVFDLDELITPQAIIPSHWLIDQISSLRKFVIVMSPCAEKLLDTEASSTHRLVQNRPFDDLFGPAMSIIIRDSTQNSEQARKKYAIIRFPYSPEVPANLALLKLPTFDLPDQFGHLTAFIHDVDTTVDTKINQMLNEERLDEWTAAIAIVNGYFEQNPNWIDARWRPKDEVVPVFQPIAPLPTTQPIRTHEDRIAASEKYNLHPPGEDSDDERGPADKETFQLHAKKGDDTDSDSEDDDYSYRKRMNPRKVQMESESDTEMQKEDDVLLKTKPS